MQEKAKQRRVGERYGTATLTGQKMKKLYSKLDMKVGERKKR